MTMWLPDVASRPGPLYQAIAEALAEDTSRGVLAAGQRLPTHRELADRLGVTVGTVTRAYAEAARRGLVSGEVGRGTFARGRVVPEAPYAPERDDVPRGPERESSAGVGRPRPGAAARAHDDAARAVA